MIGGRRFVHRHEPLIGKHRLNHRAGAITTWDFEFVFVDFDEQVLRLQIGDDFFTRVEAIEAAIGWRRVVVDDCIECKDVDQGQTVTLADGVVVEIVGGCDFHAAGAERAIDIIVGDDRNGAAGERQRDVLADQMFVALVVGMNHHGGVAQHRFRARGGDGQPTQFTLWSIDEGIKNMPKMAVFFLTHDFQIRHGSLEFRIPIHQALAAINQTVFKQPHEYFRHHFRELVVHGEIFQRPIGRGAEAAHLAGDGGAGKLLPLPHFFDELVAAEIVAFDALRFELPLDNDLRCDAGVIGAGQPQGVRAAHAVVTRQRVHDCLIERMAHMQRAGDIGRRQLDAKRFGVGFKTSIEITAGFPVRIPVGFDGLGIKAFGEFGHSVMWMMRLKKDYSGRRYCSLGFALRRIAGRRMDIASWRGIGWKPLRYCLSEHCCTKN